MSPGWARFPKAGHGQVVSGFVPAPGWFVVRAVL